MFGRMVVQQPNRRSTFAGRGGCGRCRKTSCCVCTRSRTLLLVEPKTNEMERNAPPFGVQHLFERIRSNNRLTQSLTSIREDNQSPSPQKSRQTPSSRALLLWHSEHGWQTSTVAHLVQPTPVTHSVAQKKPGSPQSRVQQPWTNSSFNCTGNTVAPFNLSPLPFW